MAKSVQYGCKNCGAVVTVETEPSSEKLDIRVKEARIKDSSGKIEIECQKCSNRVLTVDITQL